MDKKMSDSYESDIFLSNLNPTVKLTEVSLHLVSTQPLCKPREQRQPLLIQTLFIGLWHAQIGRVQRTDCTGCNVILDIYDQSFVDCIQLYFCIIHFQQRVFYNVQPY